MGSSSLTATHTAYGDSVFLTVVVATGTRAMEVEEARVATFEIAGPPIRPPITEVADIDLGAGVEAAGGR